MNIVEITARTRTIAELNSTIIPGTAKCIVAHASTDERGSQWAFRTASALTSTIEIEESQFDSFIYRVPGESGRTISLSDIAALHSVVQTPAELFIDVTALPLRVWAPLVREAVGRAIDLKVVYAEPQEYRRHSTPTSTAFDLGIRTHGLRPVPGFAKLAAPADDSDAVLVVFLGFQGHRSRYVVSHLDPLPETIPVIGVPGYNLDYAETSILMNAGFLEDTQSSSSIYVASADCPFAAAAVLEQVAQKYPDKYLYVAPLGTRPHALGCILFALSNFDRTEIIFDHPIPTVGAAVGVGPIHVYKLI